MYSFFPAMKQPPNWDYKYSNKEMVYINLKGRGHGVDLGTSILSLILSIFFSFLGLVFPYDPLNLFPLLVFLSPRPHRIGAAVGDVVDVARDENAARCSTAAVIRLAAALHHRITLILRRG